MIVLILLVSFYIVIKRKLIGRWNIQPWFAFLSHSVIQYSLFHWICFFLLLFEINSTQAIIEILAISKRQGMRRRLSLVMFRSDISVNRDFKLEITNNKHYQPNPSFSGRNESKFTSPGLVFDRVIHSGWCKPPSFICVHCHETPLLIPGWCRAVTRWFTLEFSIGRSSA